MNLKTLAGLFCLLMMCSAVFAEPVPGNDGPTAKLLELDRVTFKPSSTQVTSANEMTGTGTGLGVRIEPGDDGYPGLAIIPKDTPWDLSGYGHVEARVINTGEKPLNLSMRIDNAGDWKKNPWNTESKTIKPGESGTIKVIFGYGYGFKPNYKLDPAKVPQILLFTGKVKQPVSFLVESITAAGSPGEKPAVDPKSIRVKPKDGVILGQGVTIDPDKQVTTKDATASAVADGVQLSFSTSQRDPSATFKPAAGMWDLRDAVQVRVTLRNDGSTPLTPRLRLESKGGPSAWTTLDAPIGPGQVQQITASFISNIVWQGPTEFKGEHIPGKAETINRFTSDAASGVTISLASGNNTGTVARVLRVESIVAEAPSAPLPDWLGKRPPVEGDWKLTFEDNFDGDSIDLTRWNIYTQNFWDKRSHFTKDNVIVRDGVVTLRYEQKRGFHNDNPAEKETDYAVGFLDTYGKWVQRYGYFEARVKLPTAPGLWAAFWLMPDRGVEAGEQWKRADTANGGMEFDIMEHLTRWGPHRYNIAMHFDGYQKKHKATGTTSIYAAHDAEGFMTTGLLWLPGQAVFYCNGQEIARWDNDRISRVQSYPILDMVSGGWDNSALDDAKLPDDFVIDYIRIWQRSDLASEVDGPRPPRLE